MTQQWQSRIVGEGMEAPDQLLANPMNWRTHPTAQQDALLQALQGVGWVQRVIVNQRSGHLVDGHLRVQVALREGAQAVPVQYVDLSPDEERLVLATLDPLAGLAGVDAEILTALTDDLELDGALADMLEDLLPGMSGGGDDPDLEDPDPAAPAAKVTRPGDVWVFPDGHRVICGDAENAATVEAVLAGARPHLMVTDPPYGVSYDASWRNESGLGVFKRAEGKVGNDDRADWRAAWGLFPGEVAYVWHAALQSAAVAESLTAAGWELRSHIVWVRDQLVIGRGHYHWQHDPCFYAVRKGGTGHWQGSRKETTAWQIPKPRASETGHSTQKPVECMARPIRNNSAEGEAVYDPFLGSGTTLIAAQQLGRVCFGVELLPEYVDLACLRYEQLTGDSPRRESDGQLFADLYAAALGEAEAPADDKAGA